MNYIPMDKRYKFKMVVTSVDPNSDVGVLAMLVQW